MRCEGSYGTTVAAGNDRVVTKRQKMQGAAMGHKGLREATRICEVLWQTIGAVRVHGGHGGCEWLQGPQRQRASEVAIGGHEGTSVTTSSVTFGHQHHMHMP